MRLFPFHDMPIVVSNIARNDPRLQITAYVTDGKQLFEVVKAGSGVATLENCVTGAWFVMSTTHILQHIRLVRRAISAPSDAGDLVEEKA